MEFLGIGPLELMLVAIVALLVIKPEDWGKTGRTLAGWINQITSSDAWRAVNESWRAASKLTTELRREANLENSLRELDELVGAQQRMVPAFSYRDADQGEPNTIRPAHKLSSASTAPTSPARKKEPTRSRANKSAVTKTAPAKPKRPKPKKKNA